MKVHLLIDFAPDVVCTVYYL